MNKKKQNDIEHDIECFPIAKYKYISSQSMGGDGMQAVYHRCAACVFLNRLPSSHYSHSE